MTTAGERGHVRVDLEQTSKDGRKAGLPSSYLEMIQLQREIDLGLEWTKREVWCAHYGNKPYSEPFRLTRSKRLLRAMHDNEFPLSRETLERWAAWHRNKTRRLARLRDRLIARRDQLYYEAAHELCRKSQALVIESEAPKQRKKRPEQAMDLRDLATVDSPAGEQRHFASPSRFREILRRVAAQHSTTIELIRKHRTSTTCPTCGSQAESGPELVRECANGHLFSQVEAACLELLARWRNGDGEDGGARLDQVPDLAS
jgi:hypothetical protein